MGYKLCPRCELNYILDDDYCSVCKAELKIGPQLIFAVDDEDEIQEKLCPVCKQNYIHIDKDMCRQCINDCYELEKDIDFDADDEWKNYLDDDEKDEILNGDASEELLSLNQLQQEESDEIFDDEEEFLEPEEEYYNDEDDLDFDYDDDELDGLDDDEDDLDLDDDDDLDDDY